MAGIKGRSGRKGWDKELDTKELWDISIGILRLALKAPEERVPLSKKIDVATFLVGKLAPKESKIDLTVQEPIEVEIIHNYAAKIEGGDASCPRTK